MKTHIRVGMRIRSLRGVAASLMALVPVGVTIAHPAPAVAVSDSAQVNIRSGGFDYVAAPDLPGTLGSVAFDDENSQVIAAQLPAWSLLDATGTGDGWRVTVSGDDGAGKSPVFREYCTNGAAANGCDDIDGQGTPGPGYVSPGIHLGDLGSGDDGSGRMTLTSEGAVFGALDGTTGVAPTHLCSANCTVDGLSSGEPAGVAVASAAQEAGMGRWRAGNYPTSTVSVAVPAAAQPLDVDGVGNKVYRIDLLWTASTGPAGCSTSPEALPREHAPRPISPQCVVPRPL